MVSGETGDKHTKSQAFCNLAYAHSKTEEYPEAKEAFQKAIKCSEECDEHTEACLATEGLAAIYFRENDYENAIKYYKEALAILTKANDVNSAHSERIVNKLSEAVEFQLSVKEEGDEFDGIPNQGSRHYGRRRGKPRYGTVNSLVAKGLEETNDELEEESSSADISESIYESESSSERRVSDEQGKMSFYERASDDGRATSSKANEDASVRRRHYSTQSYNGTSGRITLLENGSDEEEASRQRKRTSEIERARNSRTCIVQ